MILPNQADGVPFLTTAPVYPGQTHLYKFKVVQNGTYWYHSHSALQEQSGMYGALIFKPAGQAMREQTTMNHGTPHQSMQMGQPSYAREYSLVLSEWADENPMQIQRRLRFERRRR